MKLRNKKTGEIVEDVKYIDTSLTTIEIHYLDDGVLRMKTEKNYHSFLQNWEDYDVPKEPLIKEEKIRKAVRAWAEAQGLTEVYCASNGYEIYGGVDDYVIQFEGEPFPFADRNKIYSITELCGEVEE